MWGHKSTVLIIAAMFSASVMAVAQDYQAIELVVPQAPAASVAFQLVIAARLQRGTRLRVTTDTGVTLGVITPFGQELAGRVARSVVPVSPSSVTDGRIRLRLQIIEPGNLPRMPRGDEVQLVEISAVQHSP